VGSLEFDHLLALAGGHLSLAQTTTSSTTTGEFVAFQQWALFAVTVAALVGLCKLTYVVFTGEHRDVVAARLSLEQVASAFFVRLVLQEARRLFSVIDDHLPLALSQSQAAKPELSRFDHFCKSLKDIPAEELDDRGKYANVIKECFGRIISDSAGCLFDAMASAGTSSSSSPLNPTSARFSLEGDGFLNFAGVAEFDYQNRKLEGRFRRLWALVGVFSIAGILACVGVPVGILSNKSWTQQCAWWSIVAGVASGVLALTAFALSYIVKRSLIRRSQTYGDPSAVDEFVQETRSRNARTDN
jgi:hypothetical protein